MPISKAVTAVSIFLIASATGVAVAGPPTPADAGQQGAASRKGSERVNPVHLPTGQSGNQPVPERSVPSRPTSTTSGTPLYQNSQRPSPRGVASSTSGRRDEAAQGQEGANKLGQTDLQHIVSEKNEAEHLQDNILKGRDAPPPKHTGDAIFGPSAPRGPTRSTSGAARSSTIGASGIVPPDDPEDSN
ncbi:MAG TPA: hypothetical protein VJT80_23175 [Steroidobacteraceae bacterium]|nr:hypothetical protein [Steroidobacteraceae bacterium]